MVSANVNRIGMEFGDMVEERDLAGFVALAGLGAVGGVLAEMFQDRVAPMLNQPADPSNATGLAGSFGIKMLAAIILGFFATKMDGIAMTAVGALAVGAAIDSGVDLLEMVDQFRGSTAASPRTSSRPRQARPARSRPVASPRTAGRARSTTARTGNNQSNDLLDAWG